MNITALPWCEPCERFTEFAQRPFCAWLDTATTGEEQRHSILAAEPFHIFRFKAGRDHATDPFGALDELLAKHKPVAAIGYFGYDLKNLIEQLPATARDDLRLPDCWFAFYDDVLTFDHHRHTAWRTSSPAAHAPVAPFCYNYNKNPRLDQPPLHSNFSQDQYRAAIRRAKDYIADGDIYQVNLSQRFQCGITASPLQLYAALRAANPAPYCAYLDIGDAQILSSSPECFLRLAGRDILTRPIKGTLPRHRDARDLLRSPKDNAELLMITDLERNDLGKVCEFGSVHVPDLVRVESYATVHHLVATVAGQLRPDVSHVQALRACFPGGSITGAPKIRAMEIIDELEPHARGVYCGAIGYFGHDGNSHFNIAIRTVVHQSGLLTFHAGGGIVADSEPDAEYDETLAKAEGILRALDQLRLRQR
ncbi:MAG: aminodeoxychorismate synthase component I [Verrucomicrobia bacterium]|nr:aminodeoxychorismate synthase component I [Verrucomicrobiota bacterium]